MRKYVVEKRGFHELQIKNKCTGKIWGLFDRFEKEQLGQLCNELNFLDEGLSQLKIERAQLMQENLAAEEVLLNIQTTLSQLINEKRNLAKKYNESKEDFLLQVAFNNQANGLEELKRILFPHEGPVDKDALVEDI